MKKINEAKKKKTDSTLASLAKTAREAFDKEKGAQQVKYDIPENPIASFDLTHTLSTSAYFDSGELYQLLAVGMNNGGTVVFDLIQCVEKFVLELQGGSVTSIQLNESLLINGSNYGTIYIFSLNQ